MQGLLTSKSYLKEFIEELVVRYGDCKASRIKFPHQEHFPAEGKKNQPEFTETVTSPHQELHEHQEFQLYQRIISVEQAVTSERQLLIQVFGHLHTKPADANGGRNRVRYLELIRRLRRKFGEG